MLVCVRMHRNATYVCTVINLVSCYLDMGFMINNFCEKKRKAVWLVFLYGTCVSLQCGFSINIVGAANIMSTSLCELFSTPSS